MPGAKGKGKHRRKRRSCRHATYENSSIKESVTEKTVEVCVAFNLVVSIAFRFCTFVSQGHQFAFQFATGFEIFAGFADFFCEEKNQRHFEKYGAPSRALRIEPVETKMPRYSRTSRGSTMDSHSS